jgi:hypothetical protein
MITYNFWANGRVPGSSLKIKCEGTVEVSDDVVDSSLTVVGQAALDACQEQFPGFVVNPPRGFKNAEGVVFYPTVQKLKGKR